MAKMMKVQAKIVVVVALLKLVKKKNWSKMKDRPREAMNRPGEMKDYPREMNRSVTLVSSLGQHYKNVLSCRYQEHSCSLALGSLSLLKKSSKF